MPASPSSPPCSTLVTTLHSAVPCFSACVQHRPLNAFCLLSPSELLLTFHFMSFHFMKFLWWKLPWTQYSLTLSLSSFVLSTTIKTEFPFWIDFYVQATWVFFLFLKHAALVPPLQLLLRVTWILTLTVLLPAMSCPSIFTRYVAFCPSGFGINLYKELSVHGRQGQVPLASLTHTR